MAYSTAYLTMDEWEKKIARWKKKYPEAINKAYDDFSPVLVHSVRYDFLSGQVLNVRTGKLRGSIHTTKWMAGRPISKLFIGTDVFYGSIWFNRGRDFLHPAINKQMGSFMQKCQTRIIEAY